MPDRLAKSMHIAMKQLIDDYPGAVKSITYDRGTEFLTPVYTSIIEKEQDFGYLVSYLNADKTLSNKYF